MSAFAGTWSIALDEEVHLRNRKEFLKNECCLLSGKSCHFGFVPVGQVTSFGGESSFYGQAILSFIHFFINIIVLIAISSVNCDSNS